MIQYVLWFVSFISLWITLVWLNVLVLEPQPTPRIPRHLPCVTIALPCYNKAPFLEKTVRSLAALHYPKHLLQVIVVDDCSEDNTLAEAKRMQHAYPHIRIDLLQHTVNQGKAAAMNTALAHATGSLFTCLDADTRVHADALRNLVCHFADTKVGAVIGQVMVDEPHTFFEHIQRVEYVFSNFIRRMMSNLGTLCTAPGGACSIFQTATVRRVGGFADGALTEDLEIALRLRSQGAVVRLEPRAITYTSVPKNWSVLWQQRIRWYRGFFFNHLRYRHLMFKREQGLYGWFQMPLNVLSILLLMLTVILVSYGNGRDLYEMVYRSLTINGYFVNYVLDLPNLKELLLAQNVHIMLPIIVGAVLGGYIVCVAHQKIHERLLRNMHHVLLYFIVFPYVTTIHWLSALLHEALRTRRKW